MFAKMSDSNVIIPAAFAEKMGKEKFQELTQQGSVTYDISEFDSYDVKEVAYGEKVVGTLTNDEAMLYIAIRKAHEDMMETNRHISSELLIKSGEAIRDRVEKQSGESFVDEEQAKLFFKKQAYKEYLIALLGWQIAERLNEHDYTLEVRSNRRIVQAYRKW